MTLETQAEQKLLSDGFSKPDIRAIMAIFAAVPYGSQLAMMGGLHHDYWHKGGTVVKQYQEQVSAIARTYRETFKDAAKRKELYEGR